MQKRTPPAFAAVLALGALGAAAAAAGAEEIFAVTLRTGSVAPSIFRFDSATPSVISPLVPLTGAVPIAIDFRPSTGQLYGVGSLSDNRLFTIDTATGAVSAVGPISPAPISAAVGLDFNPVTDELRATIVEPHPFAQRANLRIDPATGASVFEGNLRYAPGDPNAGRVPSVVARPTPTTWPVPSRRACTASTPGDVLVSIEPESAGTLRTVGRLGFGPDLIGTNLLGFDISGVTGTAYVVATPNIGPNAFVPQALHGEPGHGRGHAGGRHRRRHGTTVGGRHVGGARAERGDPGTRHPAAAGHGIAGGWRGGRAQAAQSGQARARA